MALKADFTLELYNVSLALVHSGLNITLNKAE